ncbi:ribonuclease H-like domain-containing protein [Tanacetum coccineum]
MCLHLSTEWYSRKKTFALVKCCKFKNKYYDLELEYLNGLKIFNNDPEEDLSNELYDDGRDSRFKRGKSTDLSQGGTKYTDSARRDDVGHPGDGISADCNNLESAIPDQNDNKSQGDDTAYQEYNDLFLSPVINPQSVNLRRYSMFERGKSTYQLSQGGTEYTDSARRDDEGHPDDGISSEADCDNLESAIRDENDNKSEGCLLTIVVHNNRPIFQLDINNAFLSGDLVEDVYMSLPKRPYGTPIETKESSTKPKKVLVDNPLTGINNYQKLVGNLIYLTNTRPDISYAVHVLSQFMHAPVQYYLKLAFRGLKMSKLESSMAGVQV